MARAKQDFGGAVPQGHDLVRVCPHWNTKRPSKAEISEFEVVSVVDEKVLGLEIPMEDAV